MNDPTNKARQAAFRKKKREDGLQEVRGIFAPVQMHEAIKQAAKQMLETKGVAKVPKQYLQCGELVSLHFVGRIGRSGTIVDVVADASMMAQDCGNDPSAAPGNSIGTVVRGKYTADVFIEMDTGRLWYDNEKWY